VSVPTQAEWTYTGPNSSDRDEVRFYLGDTDPALPLLGDAELDFLLDVWLSIYDSKIYVAAVAAELIANRLVGLVTVSGDGISVDASTLSERYRALAVQLRSIYRAAQISGGVDISNLLIGSSLDPRIEPLVFSVGMHDNVFAGQQDFGGVVDPWRQAQEAAELLGRA
jgi:hypothetical protein